ncbi:hypothetical protein PACTADRAFT_646 [Pachysolen tannophilus NRRL Y-2460]|uniref:ATPase inhibitor, mitochondrial n=1 Tax=Pachysolen tannophilus NRRL Y-2460 TaxID=669874 RepID=A0A1E4U2E3_PACTA|nr:hypothetical protein PACTADRAFT_646 [Pachysolen tannophilus NRRL Y-2460]
MIARRAVASISKLNPSFAVRAYSNEGSTGAPRPDGKSDAFTKREKTNEDYYVKKHEAEVLASLKEQLKKQKEHLNDLEKKIDDLNK